MRLRHRPYQKGRETGWGYLTVTSDRDLAVLALRYGKRNTAVHTLHNLAQAPHKVIFDPRLGERGALLVKMP